jgi:predicted dehydrogenase
MVLRVIQVGLGGWGRNWAKLLRTAPELVEVVASVELVPELRELFSEQLADEAGDVLPDLATALAAHPEADAVVVTTAVEGHLPVALEAIAAGKHVLVEKPFGPSADEAAAVVEAADRAGVLLAVSQNYRWYPAVVAAQQVLASGELGALGSVALRFRKWANDQPADSRHLALRHPLLVDMSIHHLDLMRILVGEPVRVHWRASNPSWSNFREPAEAVAIAEFDTGVAVDYSGSWVSRGESTPWAGRWTFECELGVLEFQSRDEDDPSIDIAWVTLAADGVRRELPMPEVRYTDRLGSVAELARAIAAGDEPSISGRDNLGTLAFMDAAVESAETNQAVAVRR